MHIRHGFTATFMGLALAANAASSAQDGQLARPDIERWVFLTATVGHGPAGEEGERKFSTEKPGRILITRMEPGAYDYFMEHGEYADGTTFAVPFHDPLENPKPAMDGLVLGDMAMMVVHRLERAGQGWQHAYYAFENGKDTAERLPEGNPCHACHQQHGKLDGTFVQFYPPLRGRLQAGVPDTVAATDEQEVVQAVRTMFDALRKNDMPRYESVMAPDFYAFEAGKRMVSDELVEIVKSSRESGLEFEWNVTEPEVRIEGPMAWVTYVNRGAISKGAKRKELVWMESAALRREAGGWRIQFLHSTPMADE